MKKSFVLAALLPLAVAAQDIKKELNAELRTQVEFPATVPAGNYSGITWLGGNEYAVVCDKAKSDGFFIFHINIDPDTGVISHAYSNEFRSSGYANRDMEGIAFLPKDTTIFISGEADNHIREYKLKTGKHTGRELIVPDSLSISAPNYGFESLTYNATQHHFWTVSESTLPIDGKPSTLKDKHQNVLRRQHTEHDWYVFLSDGLPRGHGRIIRRLLPRCARPLRPRRRKTAGDGKRVVCAYAKNRRMGEEQDIHC